MSRGIEAHLARALRGEPCQVLGLGRRPRPLPVDEWLRDADSDDHALLQLCVGATLDIGCGPGRMTAALAASGRPVLGIDVVPEAVAEAVRRGGTALCRDVHQPLPGEGRWDSALLADGNIGIGGDPTGLLRRVRSLVASGGRVVVEVAAPGIRWFALDLRLDCGGSHSRPFPWAFVGADDIADMAAAAGLLTRAVRRVGSRWCALLEAS